MKIVYISNSIIPSRTANSIHVMKMCQAFADNGHEVVLLAPDRYKEYQEGIENTFEYYGVKEKFELIKIDYSYVKGIGGFMYAMKCQKYINKFSPDLIFGRFTCGVALASLKYKAVLELHSPISGLSKIDKLFFNLFKNKFYKLVLISEALKNIYINENILKNISKYIVAHDGADEVKDFKTKIELKGDKNKLKVGYVGHLYKGRGIDLILNCAQKLKDFTFHIVGGNEEDIKYWESYLKAKSINNVYFYGFVKPSETSKYRNSFDIVIAPYSNNVSISKSKLNTSMFMSPLKIFEYMSNKKPIITSDLPVLREVLNETNSILVDFNNELDWINSINSLSDFNLSNKLSKNAYNDFISKYTWEKRVDLILRACN
jgi:glycosyltransferase involved in cell wall biosynthesis